MSDNKEPGCGSLIAAFFLIVVIYILVSSCMEDSEPCRTPGALPGSAQYNRDSAECF